MMADNLASNVVKEMVHGKINENLAYGEAEDVIKMMIDGMAGDVANDVTDDDMIDNAVNKVIAAIVT